MTLVSQMLLSSLFLFGGLTVWIVVSASKLKEPVLYFMKNNKYMIFITIIVASMYNIYLYENHNKNESYYAKIHSAEFSNPIKKVSRYAKSWVKLELIDDSVSYLFYSKNVMLTSELKIYSEKHYKAQKKANTDTMYFIGQNDTVKVIFRPPTPIF